MASISIQMYKKEDHKNVYRIYSKGITDIQSIKSALLIGYKSFNVMCYLTMSIVFGCIFYSTLTGFIAFLLGLTFHALNNSTILLPFLCLVSK